MQSALSPTKPHCGRCRSDSSGKRFERLCDTDYQTVSSHLIAPSPPPPLSNYFQWILYAFPSGFTSQKLLRGIDSTLNASSIETQLGVRLASGQSCGVWRETGGLGEEGGG